MQLDARRVRCAAQLPRLQRGGRVAALLAPLLLDRGRLGAAADAQLEADKEAPPLELQSNALNMTVQARAAAALSEQPIACDTPGERASVKLPASALAGSGASADDSVGLVLYAAGLNFHGMGDLDGRGDGAGALVSFSLRQGESELSVKGLPDPVVLEMPISAPVGARCVGREDIALAEANGGKLNVSTAHGRCDEALVCSYWDGATWATDGCKTVAGESDGSVACECDHLTDFVAIKVQTNAFGKIHFVTVEPETLTVTNVDCTPGGVYTTLHKRNGTTTPSDVLAGSREKYWFQCSVAPDHVWEAELRSRALKGRGCPFCSGARASAATNSLAALKPRAAARWHPTRNGALTPSMVVAGSRKKYWFVVAPPAVDDWVACDACAAVAALSARLDHEVRAREDQSGAVAERAHAANERAHRHADPAHRLDQRRQIEHVHVALGRSELHGWRRRRRRLD